MTKKPKKKMRKLKLSDIFDIPLSSIKQYHNKKGGQKIRRYRMQQEYGERKRIKP